MKKIIKLILLLILPVLAFTQNNASFTQVGPVVFPANPSVQTTGMGRVCQVVYHPADSNIMFAVSASGGVFKSSNEGTSWKPVSDYLPQTPCASLAINPVNPKVMYLGTGDPNYNSAGLGVWKSTNGGLTWVQSSNGMGNKLVSCILFTPNDTNTLIAACSDGIYKSTNAGSTWVKKTTVSSSYRDLTYRPASNTILYSATDAYFYRSYDNGNTWLQSTLNSSITCAGIKIAVCPTDTSKLYCVVWKNGGTSPFGGIYKSVNNGTSFTLQADTPNVLGYSSNGSSKDGQGSYNLCIATDPVNSNIIYIGGINVWKSADQGATFSMKSHWAFGVHADKHGFLFSPFNHNKLYSYHDGGIDRSTDGGATWVTLEDGLSASEFYKMGSSGLYNDYIIGGLQDNGMDVATDKDFYTVRGGDWGGDFAFDAFDKEMLYENGGLKRNIKSHQTGNINGHNGIYKVHPNDSNVLFEATTNLFRTTNVRANPSTNVSWNQITSYTTNTAPNDMAYAKSSWGTFYVAFTPQAFYRSPNINSATPTFAQITTFPFKSGEQVKQLEACDYDSNVLYVLTNQSRILKTRDKGNSWVSINRNLPAVTIIKFVLDQKSTDSSMYACTAFGVYYRNRYTVNWINFSQGLPTVAQISDMEIMSDATSKSRLHISTYGRGIWQSNLYKSTPVAPVADFIIQPSTSQECANTIILVDNSTFSPTSRKWQIVPSGGWMYINGSDSLSARPEIQFTVSGSYFISLTVANSTGNNTKTVSYNYSSISVAPVCNTTTSNLGGYTIGIYRFEFNSINKASGTGNVSYEDFSCSNGTIVRAGATYTAWVTNGSSYNENARIYIDYNNNGLFTDANEYVGSISSGLGRRSCNITISSNPPVANKFLRLRVVSDYSAVTSPCGTLSYGQSEDYAVLIDKSKPAVSINIPKPTVSNGFTATFKASEIISGFDATDITVSNATLSGFTQTDAYTYTAKITPSNNGLIKIDIAANSFSDIAGNYNLANSNSTTFFLGIKSFSFAGLSIKDSIVQTPTGGSIICYVPFGTNTDSLIATFVLSDTSTAYIGAVLQKSAITKNSFKNIQTYVVKSKDNSLSKSYTAAVIVNKNQECNMLTYGFVSPSVTGIITQNSTGGIIKITVPFGTNITKLTSIFSLSDSSKAYINSVKQVSNITINDFSTQLVYRIVAQDTAFSKTYKVTVYFGKSTLCDMLTYAIQNPSVSGTIQPSGSTGGNISVVLPYGVSLNNLTALFSISDSASVYIGSVVQKSGITVNNFSSALSYKVIAQDTNFSKTYLVSVSNEPNTEAELTSYSILNPASTGVITKTPTGGIVNITLPPATDVTNLVSEFVISDSAKAYVNGLLQESAVSQNNYTDTLVFSVVAQNKINTKTYLIAVKVSTSDDVLRIGDRFQIYPNPSTDQLHILYDQPQRIITGYEIVNVVGKLVIKGKLFDRDTRVDVSDLPAGIYYIQIKTGVKAVSGKFIKE
jgi:photosystem II stability/assembly factor-like uncharacterized protein